MPFMAGRNQVDVSAILSNWQKICHEKCAVVLIVLVWDTQPWYPIVFDLLVQSPLLLPPHKQFLVDPFNRVQPLVAKGQL